MLIKFLHKIVDTTTQVSYKVIKEVTEDRDYVALKAKVNGKVVIKNEIIEVFLMKERPKYARTGESQ